MHKSFGVAEGLEGRHLHIVGIDRVIGAVAAEADVGAGVAAENLGADDACERIERRLGRRREMPWQTVDLLAVEDGVALEERDRVLGLLAVVGSLGARDAIGIDDETAMFAFVDLAAQLGRLVSIRRGPRRFERQAAAA